MSVWTKATDAIKMIEVGFKGFEILEGVLNKDLDKGIIPIARAVVRAIREGFEGKSTPDIVLAELAALKAAALQDTIADNDADADAALAAKFPEESKR